MKVVGIADMHNYTQITLPEGDLLAIAGDWTMGGTISEITAFLKWLAPLKNNFKHIIFIAGNHDLLTENNPALFQSLRETLLPKEIIYLENSGIEIDGKIIWGSPITPKFYRWAWMPPVAERVRQWQKIPENCDLLITHGPPHMILDIVDGGKHAGCTYLLNEIKYKKVRNHLSGHLHSNYGFAKLGFCNFYNATIVNEAYDNVNSPIVFEI